MILQLLISAFMAASVNYIAYTSPEKDYTFEVNENAALERQPDQTGGYTDRFDIAHDTVTQIVDYSLSITKITIGEKLTIENISEPVVKDSFAASCNCVLSDTKLTSYKNITGVRYTYTMKSAETLLSGYTIMVPKEENLYSLTFIASEVNFKKYKDEYEHTINSIQLLK